MLALAAAIRLVHLGAASLWLDEIFQSYLVHAPAKTFWASLRFDAVHPPGDYLVGRAVEVFHPSDTAKKIPGVLWGVGSIAALAALMRRRGGARVGFLTAALLAVGAFHVRYSQEYRPYALRTFFACLSLWLLDRALERPTLGRRAATLLAMLAAAYTLYVAVVAIAIGAAALAGTDAWSPDAGRRANARSTLRLAPMAAALLASSTPPGGASSEGPRVAWTTHPPQGIGSEQWRLLFAFFTVSYKQEGWSFGYRPLYGAVFAITLALAGGTIACLRRTRSFRARLGVRRPGHDGGLAGGLACVRAVPLQPPSGIALAGVAAAGIDALPARRRVVAAASVAVVVLFQAYALVSYYRNGRYDWSRLVAFLRSAAGVGEDLHVDPQPGQYCLAYYLCGPEWLTDGERCGREIVNTSREQRRRWMRRGPRAGAPGSCWTACPRRRGPRAWAEGSFRPRRAFPEAEGSVLKALGAPSYR